MGIYFLTGEPRLLYIIVYVSFEQAYITFSCLMEEVLDCYSFRKLFYLKFGTDYVLGRKIFPRTQKTVVADDKFIFIDWCLAIHEDRNFFIVVYIFDCVQGEVNIQSDIGMKITMKAYYFKSEICKGDLNFHWQDEKDFNFTLKTSSLLVQFHGVVMVSLI